MSENPYSKLSDRSFWRPSVTNKDALDFDQLYLKKFDISSIDKIATAGSCFAQYLTRAMKSKGYSIFDVEPPPIDLHERHHQERGYNLYSGRYANIYTVRQLLCLAKEAFGLIENPDPVWSKGNTFYDSMRPSVEPEGLSSVTEVLLHRAEHLKKVKKMFEEMDVFIFTLGLTETWEYKNTGWVFPIVPGVIAGEFNDDDYRFKNFSFIEIFSDLKELIDLFSKYNQSNNLRYIFTVSPVPLTATYSTDHVLTASSYSKSVLRAIAGTFQKENHNIDYFPSYEIISNTWSRGIFYESNCRSIRSLGVRVVMNSFFNQHGIVEKNNVAKQAVSNTDSLFDDVECEERLLDVFGNEK